MLDEDEPLITITPTDARDEAEAKRLERHVNRDLLIALKKPICGACNHIFICHIPLCTKCECGEYLDPGVLLD